MIFWTFDLAFPIFVLVCYMANALVEASAISGLLVDDAWGSTVIFYKKRHGMVFGLQAFKDLSHQGAFRSLASLQRGELFSWTERGLSRPLLFHLECSLLGRCAVLYTSVLS